MNQTKKAKLTRAAGLAALIAIPAEGLRQYAYYDPVGILTVCYGDTSNVEKGKKYSLEECKARLETDMLESVKTVEQCAPDLPEGVLAAFSDAVYNIGPTVACDRSKSTAAKLLSAKNYEEACNQLPKWNKATLAGVKVVLPGLTKRRNAERALCLSSL
jgi:GH24 family phage-related lysozyme (muramidase)